MSAEPTRAQGSLAAGTPPGAAKLLGYAFNIAVFAAVYLFASGVAGNELPFPQITVLRPKLEHFLAEKDRYDTLFIGSSRVYRDIVPEVFAHEMALHGYPGVACYNFGVPGMRVPEAVYVLKLLLASRPAKLRWVFFELSAFDPDMGRHNELSARMIFWHDWEETWRAVAAVWRGTWRGVRAALASDEPLAARLGSAVTSLGDLDLAASHVQHFLYKITSVGRGTELITFLPSNRAWELSLETDAADLYSVLGGYVAIEDELHEMFQERQRQFEAGLDEYERLVGLLGKRDGYAPPYTDYHQELVDAVVEMVQASGADVVFTIMPGTTPERQFVRAYERGDIPALVALNDPQRFPFLYRVDQRWDMAHLRRSAALVCTRMFVEEFDALLKDRARELRKIRKRH